MINQALTRILLDSYLAQVNCDCDCCFRNDVETPQKIPANIAKK